jgi:DNA repair protein RecO (recombination protein O)
MFYYVDISKISKLDISDSIKNQINYFLDEYYEDYTGLYLKSKSFLNDINKIKEDVDE